MIRPDGKQVAIGTSEYSFGSVRGHVEIMLAVSGRAGSIQDKRWTRCLQGLRLGLGDRGPENVWNSEAAMPPHSQLSES